jgi:hypothetical protein
MLRCRSRQMPHQFGATGAGTDPPPALTYVHSQTIKIIIRHTVVIVFIFMTIPACHSDIRPIGKCLNKNMLKYFHLCTYIWGVGTRKQQEVSRFAPTRFLSFFYILNKIINTNNDGSNISYRTFRIEHSIIIFKIGCPPNTEYGILCGSDFNSAEFRGSSENIIPRNSAEVQRT